MATYHSNAGPSRPNSPRGPRPDHLAVVERAGPPKPKATYSLKPRTWFGQSRDEILAQRQRHLSAGQYHFYKEPLLLVEAKMQYCFDEKGNQYVDAYSNVCHVGHCHPHFVRNTQMALENIISNTRYLHPAIGNYAERLKSKMPPSLCVCYFVNSGSEANDLAIRLARVHTNRKGIVCLTGAYHGTTATCTGVSTSLSTGTTKGAQDYQYCARDVYTVPVPDTYRGEYRADDPCAGEKYANYVDACLVDNKDQIAAFIHESVQGVGGQIVYPIDYLQHAYAAVRHNGGVCIADEVQTGFGRTGTHFWAFEAQGVVPDILTLGKPIGNGFPLGAVICTREIAQSFDGVQYFNTNGGNPVACAAGMAVLDIIEADGLQRNALDLSLAFMPKLKHLMETHEIVGDVRGVGLFIGIELVRNRDTLEPAREETAEAMERCRHHGLLVGKGGANNNVLRLKPPMCITPEDLDFMVRTLDLVLSEIENGPAYISHRNGGAKQKFASPSQRSIPPTYHVPSGGRGRSFDRDEDFPRTKPSTNGNGHARPSRRADWSDGEDVASPAARRLRTEDGSQALAASARVRVRPVVAAQPRGGLHAPERTQDTRGKEPQRQRPRLRLGFRTPPPHELGRRPPVRRRQVSTVNAHCVVCSACFVGPPRLEHWTSNASSLN
jgi:4-aminobutyrate aminotransferase-like enzyme